MARPLHDTVAVCTPGLEPWLLDELRVLGVRTGGPTRGLVPFRATTRQLYLVNRWTRVANRIVVRLGRFTATNWAELERGADRLPWAEVLGDGVAPAFRVSAAKSKLIHTDAIAQRLHQLVGPPALGDQPEQLFVVRLNRDLVTISADTSGESLHKRGWRQAVGPAPLRENLAAALLLVAGWDGSTPLVDPFCGSGTIPIEAARLAAGLPPRLDRVYALERWPTFEPGTWASVLADRGPSAPVGDPAPIVASDRDPTVVEATIANAERAGVADRVTAEARVVSHLKGLRGPGWVVTNPPYGHRVGDADRLARLYGRFGAVVAERLPGFGVVMLSAERRMASATGLAFERVGETSNGGLRVQLVRAAPAADPGPPPADEAVADA
jgi:putative N6-adenine-specific DNA methylase